jgi:hypothetical protein
MSTEHCLKIDEKRKNVSNELIIWSNCGPEPFAESDKARRGRGRFSPRPGRESNLLLLVHLEVQSRR